jgi:hypothetical protein
VNSLNCKWKTAFRAGWTGYDQGMLKAPTDADIVRLRQFLVRLESDAQEGVEDAEFCQHEIDRLKSEIAYLEAARSRAFLAQIGIDFGAAAPRRWNYSAERGKPS